MDNNFENTIEISMIDLQYENFRLPDKRIMQQLLASVADKGILEPVKGIFQGNKFLLLDGFKRIHCAKKLNINMVTFETIATDGVSGIIHFLKISNPRGLHILEQAKLVEELRSTHQMSVGEIATKLGKSSSWVSTRINLLKKTSSYVLKQIFKGDFPARSAMYTLRQFTRVKIYDVDDFVKSVSGKNLSVAEIELLAQGYFEGCQSLKEQIQKGDLAWAIGNLKGENKPQPCQLSDLEKTTLNDLGIFQKYMNRLILKLPQIKHESNSFKATAGLLAENVLDRIDDISGCLKGLCREKIK